MKANKNWVGNFCVRQSLDSHPLQNIWLKRISELEDFKNPIDCMIRLSKQTQTERDELISYYEYLRSTNKED